MSWFKMTRLRATSEENVRDACTPDTSFLQERRITYESFHVSSISRARLDFRSCFTPDVIQSGISRRSAARVTINDLRVPRTYIHEIRVRHQLHRLQIDLVVAQDGRVLSQPHVTQKLREIGGVSYRCSRAFPLSVCLTNTLTLRQPKIGTTTAGGEGEGRDMSRPRSPSPIVRVRHCYITR